jgi:hypothetical protein
MPVSHYKVFKLPYKINSFLEVITLRPYLEMADKTMTGMGQTNTDWCGLSQC